MAAHHLIDRPIVYKDIPGAIGYRATGEGNVESCLDLRIPGLPQATWHPIKGFRVPGNDHMSIGIKINGRLTTRSLRRLILIAFHGPCPPDHEPWAKDGNRLNTRPENLIWAPRVCTRFWYRLVSSLHGCWEWTGAKDQKGYGNVAFKGKHYKAHQLAYELAVGSRNGLFVLHRCDNPPCCNPDHLFLGTNRDNVDDMIAKGRHLVDRVYNGVKGEANSGAKITEADVRWICETYAKGGVTMKQLGQKFGMSAPTICNLIHKKRWKHIHSEE